MNFYPWPILGAAILAAMTANGQSTVSVSDLIRHGEGLQIVVNDPDAQYNQFSLWQSSDMSPDSWELVAGCDAEPINSQRHNFLTPEVSGSVFYRVTADHIEGAPTMLNQIQGGQLPALSAAGELDVASFLLAETETTWKEWRVVRNWASNHGYDIGNRGESCDNDHPVHSVSWFDTIKWCNARSELEGLRPVYTLGEEVYRTGEAIPNQDRSANGYRLPNEAEWEFAARGGRSTSNFTYSGSNDPAQVGWVNSNSGGADCAQDEDRGPQPVGQTLPNELGQFDMSGNVWEWCWDAVGDFRRIRGGSWNDDAASAELAAQSSANPASRLATLGFRLARNVSAYPANEPPLVNLHAPILTQTDSFSRIFVIGDSTVANYGSSYYPWRGWGQELANFFRTEYVEVINRARGGRSSRSFIEEGLWDGVKGELQDGDFLLIQWGHNDRDWSRPERYTPTDDYKVYLAQYVNEARALGVEPILVTPMVMNAWSGDTMRNVFTESGNDYAGAMKQVAAELDVPLIDLNAMSYALFSSLDYDTNARFYFNNYVAGEYPNYPSGNTDYTHFQQMGALTMSKFVCEGLRSLSADPKVGNLANALKPLYPFSIKTNLPAAGRITLNTELPEGATFTLKALEESGHSFINWKTGSNQLYSANSLMSFTIGAQPYSFIAYFDNETQVSAATPGEIIPGGTLYDYAIALTADAVDLDGDIDRVDFYAGNPGALIGQDNTPPYQIVWNTNGAALSFWVEVIDNIGARTVSEVININTTLANQPPIVNLSTPADGGTINFREVITIAATASDADGSVAKVQFYINGELFAEDAAAPYTADWSFRHSGTHVVGARALDDDGFHSALDSATIQVTGETITTLLQEAEQAQLAGSFTIVDDATASGGQAVEAVSGPADSNYAEFTFNVETPGIYVLRAEIRAIDGNHDSMLISVDGAAADQYLWDAARAASFTSDYVSNRNGADPVELNLSAGLHTVRFGYRENLFLDLVELEFVR